MARLAKSIPTLALGLALVGCGTPIQSATPAFGPSRAAAPTAPEKTYPLVMPLLGQVSANPGSPMASPTGTGVPASQPTIVDADAPAGAPEEAASYQTRQAFVPNQIILALKPGAHLSRSLQGLGGGRTVSAVDVGVTYQTVQLPAGMSVEQAIGFFQQDPAVASAAPNRMYSAAATVAPNDSLFDKQWGMDKIGAPDAWASNIDCHGVTVAVLDTGIDYNHPDLAGRVMIGWNFADGTKDVMDHFGHGTHVAGIIGAQGNNGVGVAGVAWNVNLMAIKVLKDDGTGTTDSVVQGIKYATDYGARVINMSLGSSDTSVDPAISQAIAYARAHGVLVIAAAGNNGGEVGSPANDPGAIAVSSTSKFLFFEYLSFFSNRGPKVEVAAPGGAIWSTVPTGPNQTGQTGYAKLSGTSMAAPMVSGEAAMIIARHPDWSAEAVQARIDQAVDDKGSSGRDPKYGFGRIRLDLAVR